MQGSCEGEGGAAIASGCLIVAVAVFVVFIFVGTLVGVFFLSLICQRIAQRHLGILERTILASDYVVVDLCSTPLHPEIEDMESGALPVTEAIAALGPNPHPCRLPQLM